MKTSLLEAKYWYIQRPAHKLLLWFVWKLPKTLVMWCAVRVGANATTGKYSNQIVPELSFMDALERWDK